jgi:hypothetical protein
MIWVEKKTINPPSISMTDMIERNAAVILFIFNDSNLFASGNRIKDTNRAVPRIMRIGLARTRAAKSRNIEPNVKNIF